MPIRAQKNSLKLSEQSVVAPDLDQTVQSCHTMAQMSDFPVLSAIVSLKTAQTTTKLAPDLDQTVQGCHVTQWLKCRIFQCFLQLFH